jgi:dihydrofolate reductase
MRRIRYRVAASLDGYIAGPNGEADWIPMDPDVDFAAVYAQFDTLLIGRRTFDGMVKAGRPGIPGMKTIVFSRTMKQRGHPDVTIVSKNVEEAVTALRAAPGKDIWLFGGGQLFGSLMAMDLVDTIEVALVPVLLGEGTPLLPASRRAKLELIKHKVYPKTGIVGLEYAVR